MKYRLDGSPNWITYVVMNSLLHTLKIEFGGWNNYIPKMTIFEPLYPINMLFCTAKGILKGVAMDCKAARVSWTVLTGCDPKGCYKYKETKRDVTVEPELRVLFFEDNRRSHKPRKADSD